jgi:hypothetical protein
LKSEAGKLKSELELAESRKILAGDGSPWAGAGSGQNEHEHLAAKDFERLTQTVQALLQNRTILAVR